jgi:pyruvate/2-oxoglutarate dehydrogenase complex dihydrolipoamide dehydrogenase (E3) component
LIIFLIPEVRVDFLVMMERARRLVREAVVELEGSFAKADNTRLVRAHARLAGHKKGQSLIHAGGIIVRAARVVLDTVTRTALPPLPGLDQVQTITAESRINLRELPPRLLVLGGSNIALEMAQPFRRLGSEATILQKADQLAEREDADAAEVLKAAYPLCRVYDPRTRPRGVKRTTSSPRWQTYQDRQTIYGRQWKGA